MKKIKVLNIISDTNIGGAGKCIVTYCNNYNREKLIHLQNKFDSILKDIANDKNIPNGFFYNDWGLFYIELKPTVKAQFFPEDSPVWGNK